MAHSKHRSAYLLHAEVTHRDSAIDDNGLQTIEGWAVAHVVIDVVNAAGAEGDDLAGVNVINRAVLIVEAMDGDECSTRVPSAGASGQRTPAVD